MSMKGYHLNARAFRALWENIWMYVGNMLLLHQYFRPCLHPSNSKKKGHFAGGEHSWNELPLIVFIVLQLRYVLWFLLSMSKVPYPFFFQSLPYPAWALNAFTKVLWVTRSLWIVMKLSHERELVSRGLLGYWMGDTRCWVDMLGSRKTVAGGSVEESPRKGTAQYLSPSF